MVSEGHDWPDIQNYTLAEIGIFLRSILRKKASKQAADFSLNWLGNHVQHKGYQKILQDLRSSTQSSEPEVLSPEKVQSEWQRAAAFMRRHR